MENKIAVVTGASQGLGFEFAMKLAQDGYLPLLLARNQTKLDAAVEKIKKAGYEAQAYAVDVADSATMQDVAEKIKQQFGTIDFLINNAGLFHTDLIEDLKINDIKVDLDTSLFGAILSSKMFSPLLNKGGRVLFISSGFGIMGPAGYSIYAAAKAGMINFAEALKRELACRNISVYVAVPGDIDTPAFREEEKNMPEWMNMASARGDVMHADVAAGKILGKCKGKRFYIFSHFDVYMLYLLTKLFPKRLRDFFIDRMFPRPLTAKLK